jgi:serine-type D-Ala-D-Ala carboxypeptidase (penicillin-binding protein 5/6)
MSLPSALLGVALGLVAALIALSSAAWAQSVQVSAPVALLVDANAKAILFEKKPDELHPPASLVKLMTAEIIFDALKAGRLTLEQELPITENVWRRGGAPSGGAAMFAPLNSRVTVANLLQGLLVQSANDAALALAEGLSGSEARFVGMMNERAGVLGLKSSRFRTATGFAHPEQRVTARDMAELAQHLIATYPDRYPLFGQREFTWNNIRQTNRNPLLSLNIGADGLKTGNVAEAGFNLVGSAEQGGRRLIVVILGAETAQLRAADARRLLEWGFNNFERRKLLDREAPLTEAKVSGGVRPTLALGLREDIVMLLPKSTLDPVLTTINYKGPVRAPVAKGDELGKLQVRRGTTLALEVPIVALEDVPQGSLGKRAWDNSLDWMTGLFRRTPRT